MQMERKGIAFEKSRQFALRIVRLYAVLKDRRVPLPLCDQILRSGTGIGANLAEAKYAISKADFTSKVYIALKECAETKYWISLLFDSGAISAEEHASILADCETIFKLLMATTKTLKTAKAHDAANSVDPPVRERNSI